MSTYPAASTVTKALRRDVGIITQQTYDRQGYRVRGGREFQRGLRAS